MPLDTKYRTNQSEIMDDFSLQGEELQEALDKIATINQLLGGNRLTLQGIKKIMENCDKNKAYTIVDIGCGNGDMLRCIANYGNKHGFTFNLIGVDANAFTIQRAQQLSKEYPMISYRCEDIYDKQFSELKYDIALFTLILHHFKESEIIKILNVVMRSASLGIVVNDLHRSYIAYRLFQAVCFVFNLNKMSRIDGLISILRGFKKKELIVFSEKLNLKKYSLTWKWAFRFQWIIRLN
jgi:2-polyprenyl-3-methyl-5-hydroxy-6-metoxy-1,4-benzoquinol methylase